MLNKLKNYVAKVANSEAFIKIGMPSICMAILVFAFVLLFSLLDDNGEVARCKSLEGYYGGNKCYVKGEIK